MHIILGATGHVGSAIARNLLKKGEQVTAVVRSEEKGAELKKLGAELVLADITDVNALKEAFSKGESLFLIVPPSDPSGNAAAAENKVIDNYLEALRGSAVKKLVGLSTIGAHDDGDIGMLALGRRTERDFGKLPIQTSFVRPAYYFTNWDMALETAKSEGVIHTMFPPDLTLEMISPEDIGAFIADVMTKETPEKVYEIAGPEAYSSNDVAEAFTAALDRDVKAVETKPENWMDAYKGMGFSEESAREFSAMTKTVTDGKTAEHPEKIIRGKRTLQDHVQQLADQQVHA
ncbi:MAG: NAD(P)H-binding protein [Mucilaginibacter polytrichastri]|nr:NAD(P)H-binding protein [Mucilaginibacter polytrichastri]